MEHAGGDRAWRRAALWGILTSLLLVACSPDPPHLVGKWVVEDIAGRGIIDSSHVVLEFLPDGRLAGSATCNRLLGSYEKDGHQLSLEPVGTTMMACPEALMNQERRLLDLLPKITRSRIDETGALILETADGQSLTARHR